MLVSLSLETQRDQSISNHVLYYQCKWKWEFSLFSLSLHYGSWWWSWISNSKKKVSSSSYTRIVCCYFFAKSNKTTVVMMTTVPIGLVFLLAFSACHAAFMKNESECYYVQVLEASFLFWKTHITVGTTEVLPTVLFFRNNVIKTWVATCTVEFLSCIVVTIWSPVMLLLLTFGMSDYMAFLYIPFYLKTTVPPFPSEDDFKVIHVKSQMRKVISEAACVWQCKTVR